jgi:hypothetical protein
LRSVICSTSPVSPPCELVPIETHGEVPPVSEGTTTYRIATDAGVQWATLSRFTRGYETARVPVHNRQSA